MHLFITRLVHHVAQLRSTFWFVPGVMVLVAAMLAAITLSIDQGLVGVPLPSWVYAGGAEGARALLSTVAGSMVTIAGVGFSITIVALVLASTQFGPRLLTLFMRDVVNQATLGVFTGTFTYCILVLRTVRGSTGDVQQFVPQLAVTVAILLTIVSVAALLYFFHHVALSIQAPKLVASVGHDFDRAIDSLYPTKVGDGGRPPDQDAIPSAEHGATVAATRTGYVQVVDDAALLATARRRDVVVRLLVRPGIFIAADRPIMYALPRDRVDEETADALRDVLIVGEVRTPEDDIEFSVRQLLEVALRALSPSINDPFTAMAAIDWLSAGFARLAREEFPSRYRYDDNDVLRVVADVSTFGGIVHTVFSRIRHAGGTSPVVLNRLLEAVGIFGPYVRVPSDQAVLREEIDAVLEQGRTLHPGLPDLRELERRYEAAAAAIGTEAGG